MAKEQGKLLSGMLRKKLTGYRLREVSKQYYGVTCTGGSRSTKSIKWVVIHDTEGDTARGGASYLQHRPDGSVHMVADSTEAFLCAPDSTVCCGTGGFNYNTWHIEQPGRASWPARLWVRRPLQLRRVAWHVAKKLVDLNLPCKFRTAAELRQGLPGYTTHAEITKSNLGTTTHTDPGTGFPLNKAAGWSQKKLIKFYFKKFGNKAPTYKVR